MTSEQQNNALLWLTIGGIIAAIGITFSIIFSIIFNNQITELTATCVTNGGQPIVEKKNLFYCYHIALLATVKTYRKKCALFILK